MKNSRVLNEENYRQAVKFAENFTAETKAEYLAEVQARHAFDQANSTADWQNFAQKRPLIKVVSALLLLIGAITSAFYWQTGRYQIVRQGEWQHQAFQTQLALEDKEQKNNRYILNLQERLRENPNNGELWYELGQVYALNNDFDAAMICYTNAQKVLGEKAAILGAMATADYYARQQTLSAQAKQWLERALRLDPKESSSLLLLASQAYAHKQYPQALDYWRKVLDSDNESIDRRAIIQRIDMTYQQMKMP